MSALVTLRQRFAAALSTVDDAAGDLVELVLPSQNAQFGDYQANCAMPLAKRVGKLPREVAAALVAALEVDDFCEPPEIAGPGFINLRLRDEWIVERLSAALADSDRLGVTQAEAPRSYVIDFSSPNVAKPMHVGHIRSTVIGDALSRVLRFLGCPVTTDNHIGDWGTQFGMIIYGYKHFADEAALARAPVAELSRLYKLVNRLAEHHAIRTTGIPALQAKLTEAEDRVEELRAVQPTGDKKRDKEAAKAFRKAEELQKQTAGDLAAALKKIANDDADEEFSKLAQAHPDAGARALEETAKLHAGDPENRALWERFLPACLEEIEATYRRLGVTFDHALGESFYHDALPGVVEGLLEQGHAEVSDGAVCVFLPEHAAPFIVRKQDGAFLYATTDLATIQYRLREWRPDAILYVVDHRQSLHFEQLFATARLSGVERVELTHVSFGTVLGEDGKPYKTRSGSAVGLMGLLDEAVERAHRIVSENDDARPEPQLDTDQRREAAERIGIGAIKYADLSHNRTSDYVFSYDKMLAMQGNTAAYMQYSYARVRSIFGRGGVDAQQLRSESPVILLTEPAERALGVAILRFAEALERVASDYRPNHLTAYLFELASCYSEFFQNCPVLKADTDELRTSRLALCDLTARTLQTGLDLLGIRTVERM